MNQFQENNVVNDNIQVSVGFGAPYTICIDEEEYTVQIPPNWMVDKNKGILKIKEAAKGQQAELISHTPMLLLLRVVFNDEREKFVLAYYRDGIWKCTLVQRSTIFSAREILNLSDYGCQVTANNVKQLVTYFQDFEDANYNSLPLEMAATSMGWQQNGGFLPGDARRIIPDFDKNLIEKYKAYNKSEDGQLEDWINMVAENRENPYFRILIAAAFAAPLLKIVGQRSFVLYIWCDSRGGKTAALKLAQSVWGDPNTLVCNFNSTIVGLERTATMYSDLPMCIDERQLAGKDQLSLDKIVYMLSEGQGKTRGAKTGGIQTTNTWRTIAIATGEQPLLTEGAQQTGIYSRCIEIFGKPFEDERQAAKMHTQVEQCFGIAGVEFIHYLTKFSKDSIRKTYNEIKDSIEKEVDGQAYSIVSYLAVLALAEAMATDWIFNKNIEVPETSNNDLKLSSSAIVSGLAMANEILKTQKSEKNGDINVKAAAFLSDWLISQKDHFVDNSIGTLEYFGSYDQNQNIYYILKTKLTSVLEQNGYDFSKTKRYLVKLGVIAKSKEGNKNRYGVKRKVGGNITRCIPFDMNKYQQICDEEFGSDAEEEFKEDSSQETLPIGLDEELPFA